MKISKILLLIMVVVLCALGISACSIDNKEIDNNSTNSSVSFNYPEKSNFVFEVSKDNLVVRKDEIMTVDCSLKNISNKDYYIEHGIEAITYSYNEFSEEMDAAAVLDNFKSNSEINRSLSITANESGKITVFATIYVKPSQYSDQNKLYTFEKDIIVNVVS